MTSKNSFSKLLRDGMRRNLWAIVLSGLAFFMSMLLPVLMYMQNILEDLRQSRPIMPDDVYTDMWDSAINNIQELVGAGNLFVKTAFIVLAVVCGVAMFAYMHSRQKVDFFHSLPISRTRLFASNFVTGIVCTVPMYFIMLVLTLASVGAMGFGEAINASVIGGALLDHMVGFIVIYALTVLTTILCGNTIITLLLLLWVMFSPMLIKALQMGLFSQFYSTYADTARDTKMLVQLSPVAGYFALNGTSRQDIDMAAPGSGIPMIVAYIIVTALAVALACWLFKIRRSERAGSALAFEPMKLPVKVYMCLVMGTSVGLVFLYAAGSFWFWPGLVLGTVIFHAVVEIIYAFDFKALFAKPAHMGIILAVLLVVMAALKMDVIGYDKWMPSESSVAAVHINRYTASANGKGGMSSAENIQAVRRIAEIGIENLDTDWSTSSDQDTEPTMEHERFGIFYTLSGGRTAAREYAIPYTDEVKGLLAQITASEEYKRNYLEIFQYEEEMQKRKENGAHYVNPQVYIIDGGHLEGRASIKDEDKVRQLVQTVEQDFLARKDMGIPLFTLTFGFNDTKEYEDFIDYTNVYVTKQDVNTLALIKQLTGVEPEPIPVDKIEAVKIEHYDGRGDQKLIDVTDKADISKILENALNFNSLELYDATSFWTASQNGIITIDRLYVDRFNVYASMGEDILFTLCWPKGEVPEELLAKYCPAPADDGVYTHSDAPASEVFLNPRSVNSSVGWIG